MREIKFRVWEENIKQMIYNVGIVNDELYLMLDGVGFDIVGDYREFKLMQYTGLKDKNGKEIYEGDICETATVSGKPFGTIDVVKFINGSFQLVDIDDSVLPINFGDKDIFSVEVIGNIFEHKDLLEEAIRND